MMDAVAAFQPEGAAVRGRYAKLGAATLDAILRRHDYPRPVALLLGEALTLAALCVSLFKVDGRLSIQAEGDGPVRLLVAEARSDGGLRGYVRLAEDAHARIPVAHAMAPAALIGEGRLALTLDQGPDFEPIQGVVPLEGESLAACAEAYFARSEQTLTRIRLAVAEELRPGVEPLWLSGGALLQQVAPDLARGETQDHWETLEALFATLSDHELASPDLGPETILYRLFHEDGVRLAPAQALTDFCPCDADRLAALLTRFTPEELADFVEPDGQIHARCQFCARLYRLDPAALGA